MWSGTTAEADEYKRQEYLAMTPQEWLQLEEYGRIFRQVFAKKISRDVRRKSRISEAVRTTGVPPVMSEKETGETPVIRSVYARNVISLNRRSRSGGGMARKSGAKLEPDRLGRTPLHYAVAEKNELLVISLINSGTDVNAADKNGWTALHFAAQGQFVKVAALLLDAGANVDAQDGNGNTPLSNAVFSSRGSGDLIKLLRKCGADPNLYNKYGISPLGLARTIANYDVMQFFDDPS